MLGSGQKSGGVGCEIRTKFNYATNFRRDRYEATVYQSHGGSTEGKMFQNCLKLFKKSKIQKLVQIGKSLKIDIFKQF